MRTLVKILVDSIKIHKVYFLFLTALAIGYFIYFTLSPSLIESMYEGKSLRVLNNLIQYQHKHSLEHYLELGDFVFVRMLFLLFCAGSIVYLLYLLVFTERKVSLFWIILLFSSIYILLCVFNPNSRVYSYHGLYRAGTVYQILNGFIPPPDHLFAGEPLRAPWGYHFLVACVTQLVNISPFYSATVINVICLIMVCWLVYKISQLLIQDQRANLYSVLISIFGSSIYPFNLIFSLHLRFDYFIEYRVTSIYSKFLGLNGCPIGLVCYFLFVYSLFKVVKSKKVVIPAALLFLSLLGCGFFYAPMYPGALASAGLFCVSAPILRKRNLITIEIRRILAIAVLSLLSLLFLVPYGLTISSGVKGSMAIGQLSSMSNNLVNYIFITAPLFIIIILQRKVLLRSLNRPLFLIISLIIIATCVSYIFISLVTHAEYKFLYLSLATLGIVGGISFNHMRQQRNRVVVYFVILLFFVPCVNWIYIILTRLHTLPVTYVEKGRLIHSLDSEEEDLYEWIRRETRKDSVIVDTELHVPIFAQRQLFLGMAKRPWGDIGYGPIDKLLEGRHGHDLNTIEKRKRIARKLYNLPDGRFATEPEVQSAFNSFQDVYVVTRNHFVLPLFDRLTFSEVFRSRGGTYRIYQYLCEDTRHVPSDR